MNKRNIHPGFIHGQGRGKEERNLVVASGVRVRRTRRQPPSACLASPRLAFSSRLVSRFDHNHRVLQFILAPADPTNIRVPHPCTRPALWIQKWCSTGCASPVYSASTLLFPPSAVSLRSRRRSYYEEGFSPSFYFSCATRLERIGKAQGTTDLLICGLCCTWPGLKLGSD
jgi:hypothetical protein